MKNTFLHIGLLHYICFSARQKERIRTVSTNMVKDIESFENSKKSLESHGILNDTKILSQGSNLLQVVKEMNISLPGMIVNTYFSCLVVATATLYSSSTILFDRSHDVLIILSIANLCISTLTISRLVWLTDGGHRLSLSMKNCIYHLERLKITKGCVDEDDFQLLKEELRYYSEAPITPFSAFSVSTNTLLGAFGTIVTYLIVLLQFKVSEPGGTPGNKQEEKPEEQENGTVANNNLTSN